MTTTAMMWAVGSSTMTSVVEEHTPGIPPNVFFPDAEPEDVLRQSWLNPGYADAAGNIALTVQSFVVRSASRTVVIDTCVGNGKTRALPFWNNGAWPWLDRFRAAGFDPAEVDLVVHTHTHADHVGWGTMLVGGEWRPTFPNARHLYAAAALEWARSNDDPGMEGVYADSIEPLLAADLVDTVAEDADLGSGLSLVPTPGHTPGSVAVSIGSGGASCLVTGDFMHHPVQFARPDLAEIGDVDPELARRTRRRLIEELGRSGTLVLGTHFPWVPAGYVELDADQCRFHPVAGAPARPQRAT